MYREIVEEYAAGNAQVLPQEPAPLQEIRRAEEMVGHTFPQELVDLLLEMNGDRWLLMSARDIIETALMTREYLSECYSDISRHIFFASNGCGDYYCYNVDESGTVDSGRIYIWEHETNECCVVAGSVAELIERYVNDEI